MLLLTAVFLIVLVLIQRGKGGGLAGAFGGMGGQSAFGTKAGDLFTKVTIGVATFWIILCIVMVKVLGVGGGGPLEPGDGRRRGHEARLQRPRPRPRSSRPARRREAPAAPAKTPAKECSMLKMGCA